MSNSSGPRGFGRHLYVPRLSADILEEEDRGKEHIISLDKILSDPENFPTTEEIIRKRWWETHTQDGGKGETFSPNSESKGGESLTKVSLK